MHAVYRFAQEAGDAKGRAKKPQSKSAGKTPKNKRSRKKIEEDDDEEEAVEEEEEEEEKGDDDDKPLKASTSRGECGVSVLCS